jgi:hypothetical protein
MSKPVLALGLLAVAGGAWYWALLPPLAPAAVARHAAARDGASPFPRVRLERLAEPRRAPAVERRDPFRVANAAVPASPAPTRPADAAGAPAASPSPIVPAWPHLELIGLAEAREGAGLVRTAIVSGPRGVHHARPGELVEQVYRLERVGADGADLRLLPEDRLVRLALRP